MGFLLLLLVALLLATLMVLSWPGRKPEKAYLLSAHWRTPFCFLSSCAAVAAVAACACWCCPLLDLIWLGRHANLLSAELACAIDLCKFVLLLEVNSEFERQ